MAIRRTETVERSSALIHALVGMKAGTSSPDAIRELLARVLEAAGLDHDQRVEVLGGALVAEAVRPYWEAGHGPIDAHVELRRDDAELADVIEALSPVLLARAEAKDVAREALRAIELLLEREPIRDVKAPEMGVAPQPPSAPAKPQSDGQFQLFG